MKDQRSLEEERNMAKSGDKSQFSLVCSRLSHYLKQNGGAFPGLLQSKGNFLAPALTASLQVSGNRQPLQAETTTARISDAASKPDTKETGKGSQLTIFYSGKVVVFDDFLENKAKDLVLLASKDCAAETAADYSFYIKSNQARRSSLRRFLEKRKDRLRKAPYPTMSMVVCQNYREEKQEEGQPWLSLTLES